MSIYLLKPKFQSLLRPIVKQLASKGYTANQITLLACGMSIIIAILLCIFAANRLVFILLPIWFLIRMALNAIDGMLAREYNQQSKLGGYLNELTDIVSDAFLYLPFIFLPFIYLWLVIVIIWLAGLTEIIGILGQIHGKKRHYEGPMGKSDRAFIFSFIAMLYVLLPQYNFYINYLLICIILLLLLTCFNRFKNGLNE